MWGERGDGREGDYAFTNPMSEDPTLLSFKLVSILLKSWYKFHDCVYLCMFFFIMSPMEQPSTFSFSYGMKRWWKGGHGKGCGEGRAKANREKKKD